MGVTAEVPNRGEPQARADEVALELMKQLITLASGVLALSATFVDKLKSIPVYLPLVLALSWCALVLSVFGGLQTISAIVKSRLDPEESDWSTGYGRIRARIAKYSFIVGISLFAVVAFGSLLEKRSGEDNQGVEVNVWQCEGMTEKTANQAAAEQQSRYCRLRRSSWREVFYAAIL